MYDTAPLHPSTLELAAACATHIQPQTFIDTSWCSIGREIGYSGKATTLAARFAELCWRLDSENTEVL